jgi:aspartyl-tRNA(Asn)/glutamyl-tRNA(Gln) amidotransferase subunit A
MTSRFGVVAMASSTDVTGCFATTAADAELITDIMAGRDDNDMTTLPDYFVPASVNDRQLRIGVISNFMDEGTDAGVRNRVEDYIARLEAAGHSVTPVELPLAKYSLAMYYVIVPAEVASNLARYDGVRYGTRAADVSTLDDLYGVSRDQGFVAESKRRIMIGNYVLSSGYFDAYYQKAQKARQLLINQFDQLFKDHDVLVSPVVPTTAFGFGENTDDPIKMYLSDAMTVSASLAGLPALAVPHGESDGLPVGVQLTGQRKDDATLLGLARQMETIK